MRIQQTPILVLVSIIAITAALAQAAPVNRDVVLRQVHFTGQLPVPETDLRVVTLGFAGKPLPESKLVKQLVYAVRHDLQHHGYLRARVTPTVSLVTAKALETWISIWQSMPGNNTV
jgi:hypothetical protein